MPRLNIDDIEPGDFRSSAKGLLHAATITHPISRDEIEVPPTLDPGIADYVIALDDSGRSDAILDKNGLIRKCNQPLTVLAAFGLPIKYYDEFNADWNELRLQIQKELSLDHLPPIHMRLMYGKNPPLIYKGRPNPYVDQNFNKILEWLHYAQFLISHYTFEDEHHFDQIMAAYPEAIHTQFVRIMTKTKLWKDLRYLKATRRKSYKFAITRLTSPFPKLIALALGLINEALLIMGNKTAVLLFDPFDASKGLSERSVHEVITSLGLTQIKVIDELKNSDDVPLAQATDVIAYHDNRGRLQRNGHIDFDPHFMPALVDANPAVVSANEIWDDHPFQKSLHKQLILQYAVFREVARTTKDGRALYKLLVSNEEFANRMEKNERKDERVSMLIDPSLSAKF